MALGSHISLEPLDGERGTTPHASPNTDPGHDTEPGADGHPVEAQANVAPVWLQRVSLLILVLFCVYLGVLVMILPWWHKVWDENLFIQSRPALASVLHTGAVRGLISGLGVIDIWIGVSEAVHYRDQRR